MPQSSENLNGYHPPKLRNKSQNKPCKLGGGLEYIIGRRAGMRENNESWTLRTHRSALGDYLEIDTGETWREAPFS
jgi:hypothetical protein